MKIYVYPADQWACGHYRLIWPAESLREQTTDFEFKIVGPESRDFSAFLDHKTGHVKSVHLPDDASVVVLQRPTHQWLMESVPLLRAQGITVIVDMDDDLSSIHPKNPAHWVMHPRQGDPKHDWNYANRACADATFVTTSTPELLKRYAAHGRGMVLPNYVPERYLKVEHVDNNELTWCGSLHSHPDDLGVIGGAVANLVRDGFRYRTVGTGDGVSAALGLREEAAACGAVELHQWPEAVATSGVTMAPLSDTRFNAAKSWLKPLEAMACGVPVVMSPRSEYARLHKLTGVGALASKPKQWEWELRQLLGSADRREDQSAAGREYVRDHLTIEQNAWRWLEAWNTAVDIQRGRSVRAK